MFPTHVGEVLASKSRRDPEDPWAPPGTIPGSAGPFREPLPRQAVEGPCAGSLQGMVGELRDPGAGGVFSPAHLTEAGGAQ